MRRTLHHQVEASAVRRRDSWRRRVRQPLLGDNVSLRSHRLAADRLPRLLNAGERMVAPGVEAAEAGSGPRGKGIRAGKDLSGNRRAESLSLIGRFEAADTQVFGTQPVWFIGSETRC